MSGATLAVSGAIYVAACIVYAAVGKKVLGRPHSDESRFAGVAFALWWFALAGVSFISAFTASAGLLGRVNPAFHYAVTHVAIAALVVGLWGLLYYLVYVYSGMKGLWKPLALFYLAYYLLLEYYIALADPNGVVIGRWSVTVAYGNETEGPLRGLVIGLLLVPPILGAAAYALLLLRVKGRPQRFRIAVVSISLMLWMASALLASVGGWTGTDAWQFTSRFIGLAAAVAIYGAFSPPRPIARWLAARPSPA